MNRPTRGLQSTLASLCLALALLVAPASAGAEEAVHYAKEGFAAFEHQLNGAQVAAVTFNKRIRSIRVTLKNGQHVLVVYPPHKSAATVAKVEAKHVPVTILSKAQAKEETKKPAHHKIRYIAGGVLLVVIIVVGAVLVIRRRQERD